MTGRIKKCYLLPDAKPFLLLLGVKQEGGISRFNDINQADMNIKENIHSCTKW